MRTKEKRLETRVAVELPVTMASTDIEQLRWARNLSYGGMQLKRGIDTPRPGESIALRFRLPDGQGPVLVGAKVVYDSDDYLGIQFKDIPADHQRLLDRYMSTRLGELWFV